MCDPVTIAGAALTAGGVAANSIGASQAASASNRALEAERQRQAVLQAQASAVQDHSRQLYDNFGGQQDQRAQELGSYLQSQSHAQPATPNTVASEVPSGSNIVVQNEAKQKATAQDYTDQQARALGNMRSFGDLMGTEGRAQARDAGQIGQIGSFMKGSAGVLPLELDAASHAGDTATGFGSILSGLGKVGVTAGLSGFGSNLFGSGATAAAGGALPSFAATPASTAAGLGSSLARMSPAALTLNSAFSALPSFAQPKNAYRTF